MPLLPVIKLFVTSYFAIMGAVGDGDGLQFMWEIILPLIIIVNSIQVLLLFEDKIMSKKC
jgi:hypothetical protein